MNDTNSNRLERLLPLAGLGYALLTAAGYLAGGSYPRGTSSVATVTDFYAHHHQDVEAMGVLLAWSGVVLGLFGAALVARLRHAGASTAATAVVLAGTAVAVFDALFGASMYRMLADVGTSSDVAPPALQAWHIGGSELFVGGGITLIMLGIFVGGAHILPAWLRWTGLLIGLVQPTPLGFIGSLVFLLWSAVAGVVLCVRRGYAVATASDAVTPAAA